MKTTVNVPEQTEEDKDSRVLEGMTITIEAEADDDDATHLFVAHARIAQLEAELATGKRLVHDSVDGDRISARLVAWAGEKDSK